MKTKITVITVLIATIIIALFCYGIRLSSTNIIERNISFDQVEKIDCPWKYGDGAYLGRDILYFDDCGNCAIRNDTVFFKEGAAAIVIKATQRYISGDYTMVLKRLPDGEVSYYVSK